MDPSRLIVYAGMRLFCLGESNSPEKILESSFFFQLFLLLLVDLADFRLDLFFNVEWVPAFIGCFSFQVGLHSFVVILPVVFETVILSQGTRNCLAVILD